MCRLGLTACVPAACCLSGLLGFSPDQLGTFQLQATLKSTQTGIRTHRSHWLSQSEKSKDKAGFTCSLTQGLKQYHQGLAFLLGVSGLHSPWVTLFSSSPPCSGNRVATSAPALKCFLCSSSAGKSIANLFCSGPRSLMVF